MTNQLEHVCVSERDRKRELEVLIMINYHHYTVSNILVILHNFFQRQFLLFLLDLTLSLMCLPTNLYTVPGSPGNIFKRQTAKLFMTFRGRQSRNREHTQDNSTKIWACTLAWTCKLREESQMRDLLQTMAKQCKKRKRLLFFVIVCKAKVPVSEIWVFILNLSSSAKWISLAISCHNICKTNSSKHFHQLLLSLC